MNLSRTFQKLLVKLFPPPLYKEVKVEDDYGETYVMEGPNDLVLSRIEILKVEFPIPHFKTTINALVPLKNNGLRGEVWRTKVNPCDYLDPSPPAPPKWPNKSKV